MVGRLCRAPATPGWPAPLSPGLGMLCLMAPPQILTQEDWNVVLYNGMASTSSWAALYFVALMTFGNYVLFNLLVAILVEGFQAEVRDGVPAQTITVPLLHPPAAAPVPLVVTSWSHLPLRRPSPPWGVHVRVPGADGSHLRGVSDVPSALRGAG